MAVKQIPVTSLADSTITIVLDNQAYSLRMQWNGRDESWYMYLGKQGDTPKFKCKMRIGYDLLSTFSAYEEVPQGILVVIDLNKRYGRLQRDSFSSGRMVLLYITESSKEALSDLNSTSDREFTVRADLDGRFTLASS